MFYATRLAVISFRLLDYRTTSNAKYLTILKVEPLKLYSALKIVLNHQEETYKANCCCSGQTNKPFKNA